MLSKNHNKQKKGGIAKRGGPGLDTGMHLFRWTRQSTQSQEELWHLRLADLDPERIVMLTRPGSQALVIHVFGDEKTTARLKKNFGGKVARLSSQSSTGAPQRPRPPISIRGRLRIHADPALFAADPEPTHAILVPAGMAFGTGDHATTASCLRLLCDIAPTLTPGWRALDAGTGSGLLAIAAEKLGAAAVEAFDFDPVCIRVAKENTRANRCKKISLTVADARRTGKFQKADIVLANLYSELLIASAPALLKKLKPAGRFIFSGVLKTQIDEVCSALQSLGLSPIQILTRGKWCAGLFSR
jgi:ribosomal protein L11 methyltransferase